MGAENGGIDTDCVLHSLTEQCWWRPGLKSWASIDECKIEWMSPGHLISSHCRQCLKDSKDEWSIEFLRTPPLGTIYLAWVSSTAVGGSMPRLPTGGWRHCLTAQFPVPPSSLSLQADPLPCTVLPLPQLKSIGFSLWRINLTWGFF